MPKQAPTFSNRCDGQIDTNNGEGKVGSHEEGQNNGGWAISEIHPTLLLPQTIINSQG
jgi:hypothetical protein